MFNRYGADVERSRLPFGIGKYYSSATGATVRRHDVSGRFHQNDLAVLERMDEGMDADADKAKGKVAKDDDEKETKPVEGGANRWFTLFNGDKTYWGSKTIEVHKDSTYQRMHDSLKVFKCERLNARPMTLGGFLTGGAGNSQEPGKTAQAGDGVGEKTGCVARNAKSIGAKFIIRLLNMDVDLTTGAGITPLGFGDYRLANLRSGFPPVELASRWPEQDQHKGVCDIKEKFEENSTQRLQQCLEDYEPEMLKDIRSPC